MEAARGATTRNSERRCCTIGPALTGELLEHILAKLPLPDRLACATVSPDFATAFRCTVSGLAIDLRQRSRDIGRRLTDSPVTTVAIATPAACTAHGSAAAAAAQAQLWDPEEQRLWQEAANQRLHPAGVAWRLKRACSGLTGGGKKVGGARSRPRVLTLVLVAPEMDTSTAVLQRMLVAADAEALFAAVSMPQGLLRLDGALASKLTWCNVRAASLPATLQDSTCYAALERLVLKLSPDDDELGAALATITPRTLPALRCLAMLAPAAAGVSAELHPLRHGSLTRLDLLGVQLPSGFACLQHLTALRELRVGYEEEDALEVPPLNLLGDLAALSALKQLSSLSLDSLGCGDGLHTLTSLQRLSLAPQAGARITLRGLPLLRRLVLDLSAGSSGRDLLSEAHSLVYVPAQGHGLASLQELELRCFVWRQWQAAGSDAGTSAGSGAAGEQLEGEEGGSEEEEEEEEVEEEEEDDAASSNSNSSVLEAGSGQEDAEQDAEQDGELDDGPGSAAASEAEQEAEEDEHGGQGDQGGGQDMDWAEAVGGADHGGAGAAGGADAEAEEAEEEQQHAGLLEASWGFMAAQLPQQPQGAGTNCEDGCQPPDALASLEQRYLTAVVGRLPTLTRLCLVDYMGLVDPPSLLQPPLQGTKPGVPGLPGLGTKDAAGGGSRAATPGLLLPQQGGAASASGLAGWQRAVAEMPVPGGISQYDVTYTRPAC
ncbi:hypothetical protein ACK3TF_001640 [Chlorella vulgaris]